ncbi:MAG: MBL fold metallo-hydrolase [Deltaproteobacteria bacterium]|nr:MBL fold metallo-hydrolase [Deltaproteobacteria bacterium]
MGGFRGLFILMVLSLIPLLGFSQNNGREMDLEDLAKKKAHHRQNPGGFINPWLVEGEAGGLFPFLKWKFSKNPYAEEKKTRPWFPVIPTKAKEIENQGDSITYLGHATLWVRLFNQNVITDPVFTDDIVFFIKRQAPFPIPLDKLPEFQVVLISHSHYDHLNKASIIRLGARPLYLTPLGYKDWFQEVVPGARVIELDWFETTTYQGITYRLLPAQHWTKRTPFDTNKRLWGSWLIEGDGRKVYFGADSGYFRGYREFGEKYGPIDAALMPVGLYEPRWFMKPHHMNPEEVIRAAREMKARVIIPQQWGTFDLTDEPMTLPPKDYRVAALAEGRTEKEAPLIPHGGTWYFPKTNIERNKTR